MFYRSMEELLPIFEREGIRVEIQAHPWDFCEENNETVDIVKSFRSDNVKYVYSVPHTFSTTKASATWRACCAMPGAISSHVLIADTRNHTKHCRYIVNPPGVDAVVHQHVGVGEGDVDFDALFRTLREMKFAEQTFKVGGEPIVATSLFGYPEKMKYQAVETRELIERELLRR
ncbi:sugar phosphate isomerase/epimerase [Klebsiella pneumoniae]